MCGICGEIRFDAAPASAEVIARMKDRLARRGPDAEGAYLDGAVGLGHRRLAVIDLSSASSQPMVDEEAGLALVFNGAIYNYRELRAELIARGHNFRSSGDTEVILRAYAEWGERCVERLYGMFAFAIRDRKRDSLFLARDRMGIKPLYYSHSARGFRFASNTQALLAAGDVDTRLDAVALHFHFTLHAVVPAPRTVLAGIRKLGPGCSLTLYADGRHRQRCYWSLRDVPTCDQVSEWEWVEMVRESLTAAVKQRLEVADVPVGVLLSGGLDSSILVALLAEAGASDILTFSVGFEDQPEERGSEFEYSDQVVAQYRTRHRKFLVPNEAVLRRLPEAIDAMAEPMVGQDAVAFYLLAERVSREVKVVQSGQGADEVFGGYFWYPRIAADRGPDVERLARHYFDRDHEEFLEMVQAGYAGLDYTHTAMAARLAKAGGASLLDRVLRLDVTTLVVDDPVKRVDNMTMAWGLEARVPFLDQDLVELASAIPAELRIRSGGKHLLKRIARGLLPDAVIDRPKGYFPVPALKYVRGEFLEFMREVLDSKACRERGLYRRAYVDRLLAAPERHLTRIRGNKLWHLAAFEYWLQRAGI